MKKNGKATLSLVCVFIFVALSFGTGARQYSEAREAIVSNLNSALRRAVNMHANLWLNRDTIQSYRVLQQQMGSATTLNARDDVFAEALADERPLHSYAKRFRRNAGIQISVVNVAGQQANEAVAVNVNSGYILSNTIMLMNSAKVPDAALSLRGYVYCPFTEVLSMADMTLPALFLVLSACFGALYIYIRHSNGKVLKSMASSAANDADVLSDGNGPKSRLIGDLSFNIAESCLYDASHCRVNLTPMEFSLMEMFCNTSSHFLLKKDICRQLWPGKDNADETLYALVRRLKQTLSQCSNVRISAVRGRAYQLDFSNLS